MSLPRRTRMPARAAGLAGAVALATAVTLVPVSAEATPWPGHPDRTLVQHTVRPGETATGLAVRYHAWTAELLRLNGLGSHGVIYQGQVIRIPVVVSAVHKAHGQAPKPTTHHKPNHHKPRHHKPRHHQPKPLPLLMHRTTPVGHGWTDADLTRDQVRSLVTRMAHHYGVSKSLALAIAWQESGWKERRISGAGAIGVMQVMPDTGRWMRWYAGRTLRLRDTHDNIQAGVMTLRVLQNWTVKDNNAIAAYYQGLGAVRKHGYFEDTKRYVRSVRGIQHRLIHTNSPV